MSGGYGNAMRRTRAEAATAATKTGKRHVFESGMVAHVWAQQTQDNGRSSHGNFYFEGPTIYSYGTHFPIARFVTNDKGERAVLFTTRDYSVTTAGHKSMTRHAIPAGVPVFYVRCKDEYTERAILRGEEMDHAAVREGFKTRRDACFATALKARSLYGAEAAADDARKAVSRANEYAKFFSQPWRLKPVEWPAEWTPRLAALREKESKREERKAAARERRRALDALSLAERIEHWRRGERVSIFGATETLLRVRGKEIETSRGAEFPVEHGKRAFALIAAVRARGEVWQRNGHSIHLGHFALDRIEPDGTVRAGCHVVGWPEIERCARTLGIVP